MSIDLSGKVTVKQDARGVWYARPYLGKLPSGRVARPYKSFPEARSREEAQALADAWAERVTARGEVRSMLLGDLLDMYIENAEAMGASPHSVRDYRLYARRYCAPLLGKPAGDLSSADFSDLERRLLSKGGKDGTPLSATTVRAVHQFLRGAFSWLCRRGILRSNPLLTTDKPAPCRPEAVPLDQTDLSLLDAWIASRLEGQEGRDERVTAMALWLGLRFGLRVGEVCGLRLSDANPFAARLRVSGTVVDVPGRAPWRRDKPKTGRSFRSVAMSEGDCMAMGRLLMWRQGEGAGKLDPLVTVDGGWMRPSAASARYARVRDSLGLDRRTTFHSLRHTHATWCLANGVDLVTVAERLGHADPSVTARVYAHFLDGRDAKAAAAFDAAMSALPKPAIPSDIGLPKG